MQANRKERGWSLFSYFLICLRTYGWCLFLLHSGETLNGILRSGGIFKSKGRPERVDSPGQDKAS